MDATALKLLGALALSATAFAGWRVMRSGSPQQQQQPVGEHARSHKKEDAVLRPYQGRLRAIQERTRFSAASYERDCLSLVRRVVGHPFYAAAASQAAGSQASPSRDARKLLEQTYHAMGHRQAMLLPPDVPAEEIEPRSHRWTFAVFVASMLSDLRWSDAWAPVAAADGAAQTPAGELQRSLQPWLDSESLRWLLQDDLLARHLHAFFSARSGATVFHGLVSSGRREALGETAPAREASQAEKPISPPRVQPDAAPIQRAAAAPAPQPRVMEAEVPKAEAPVRKAEMSVQKAEVAVKAEAPARSVEAPVQLTEPSVQAAIVGAAAIEAGPLSGKPLADSFMRWLADGVAAQSIPTNAPDARVHFVSDGMVLVAPGIFQEYASSQGYAAAAEIPAFSKEVQKAVCAEGWHLRGPQNASMHRFQLNRPAESGAALVVKGVVIQSPQRFIATPPAPNPALSRLM